MWYYQDSLNMFFSMTRKAAIASGIIAVILIALLGALISQVKFGKTRQPLDQVVRVPILYESPGRVVYTTGTTVDRALFEKDCWTRGGIFNACGRGCPPEAEICVEVCAYTCELSAAKQISLPDQ